MSVISLQHALCEAQLLYHPCCDRARLTEIHDQVLKPSISWLLEPLALLIVLTCCGAGLARTFDDATIISYVESNADLHEIISKFGSAAIVPKLISFVWYVSLVLHVSEASFVAYHCKKTMKLGLKNTLMWFALVSLVGFKVMGRFRFLLSAQMKAQEKKKSNRNASTSKKMAEIVTIQYEVSFSLIGDKLLKRVLGLLQ
jgi:uncharacterized membrane protein (DUF485 family)